MRRRWLAKQIRSPKIVTFVRFSSPLTLGMAVNINKQISRSWGLVLPLYYREFRQLVISHVLNYHKIPHRTMEYYGTYIYLIAPSYFNMFIFENF